MNEYAHTFSDSMVIRMVSETLGWRQEEFCGKTMWRFRKTDHYEDHVPDYINDKYAIDDIKRWIEKFERFEWRVNMSRFSGKKTYSITIIEIDEGDGREIYSEWPKNSNEGRMWCECLLQFVDYLNDNATEAEKQILLHRR